MVTKKPKGLGRGLEALFGPTAQESAASDLSMSSPGLPASLLLADMVPGSYQPRTPDGRGRAVRTGRKHQGARHHPADPGAAPER